MNPRVLWQLELAAAINKVAIVLFILFLVADFSSKGI